MRTETKYFMKKIVSPVQLDGKQSEPRVTNMRCARLKWMPVLWVAGFLALSPTHVADAATTLTFDDLSSASSGNQWARIQTGYGGLQWYNFGVTPGSIQPPTDGYRIGMVSPTNVAFNLSGDPASIASSDTFTLNSAYLTARVFDSTKQQLEV